MSNFRKNKKYHYLYKTTNTLNGKYYIGIHSTNNLNDGYLGSGKKLKYSIKKYGKENFKIERLEFFKTLEQLIQREIEIVTQELIDDPNCLNLALGGGKGWLNVSKDQKIKGGVKSGSLHAHRLKNNSEYRKEHSKRQSERFKKLHKEKKINSSRFTNKKHTDAYKKNMSNIMKKLQKGKNNSQYGTFWITDGKLNKKNKKEELIPSGWKKGRTIN